MKISYVVVDAEKLSVLEKDPQSLLRSLCPSIADYDFVAVYKTSNGRVEYYGNFKVERDLSGNIRLTQSKAKLRRPVDDVHKFWARKPWWAVSQYLATHTKEGDVICDPMCGCGMTGYEALRLRRRAVLVDLNPFAVFFIKKHDQTGQCKETPREL